MLRLYEPHPAEHHCREKQPYDEVEIAHPPILPESIAEARCFPSPS